MTKQDLIRSYQKFYHITSKERGDAIEKEGLIMSTETLVDDDYKIYQITQSCLTIQAHINSLKATVLLNSENLAIFEISAELIASKNIGIDKTHSAHTDVSNLEEVSALKYMIETAGTLACFEIIPPRELVRIE